MSNVKNNFLFLVFVNRFKEAENKPGILNEWSEYALSLSKFIPIASFFSLIFGFVIFQNFYIKFGIDVSINFSNDTVQNFFLISRLIS